MVHKTEKYRAYSMATRTVAKTRQVVMLYDGTIRFLKQAGVAIREGRIEDRFNLLVKAAEIITGLQSSIDFDNGGEVAGTLHAFYTDISRRIISLNFVKNTEESEASCESIIADLKQMRDVWDHIDHTLGKEESSESGDSTTPPPSGNTDGSGNIVLSA